MKNLISLSFLLVLAFGKGDATFPQTPFWPMEVGNKWVYEFKGNLTGRQTSSLFEVEVVDRVIKDGYTYWVVAGYPGTLGPVQSQTFHVRYNSKLKGYFYRTPSGEELPFLYGDPEAARTYAVSSGNAGGWDLENSMKYHACKGCKNQMNDEWNLKDGLGVISRNWYSPNGSWGSYVLREAHINGEVFYPGYQKDGLNIELRANPDRTKVRFEMIIRNLSEEARFLNYPSAQKFDFVVYDKDQSKVLWKWSSGQFFLESLQKDTILPGKEIKIERTWNYFDRSSNLVKAGTLLVEGVLPIVDNELKIGPIAFEAGSGFTLEGSNAIAEEILEVPALEIVVDYSKSLLDNINASSGRNTKHKVVLNGLENLFLQGGLEEELVALRVFGSNENSDCNLTSLVHPLESFKPYKALISLEDMVPSGASALTRALKSAYLDLKNHPGPKSIFLITDGGDSCGESPWDIARALNKNSPDFTLEVFGFNLSSKMQSAYKNLTKETGGSFYPFVTLVELSSLLEDLAKVNMNGGQLEIVSDEQKGEGFVVLDSYGSIVASSSVGKPVRLLEGTYSIRVLGSETIQVPSIEISKGRRTILFLEERLRELDELEAIDLKVSEMNKEVEKESDEEGSEKGGRRGIR